MGLLRFFVVFLLGIGAAVGAYATGAIDYLAHGHPFRTWQFAQSRMVLRVSDLAQGGNPNCPARYAVDNQTGRRLIVVFSQQMPLTTAPGSRGYYGGYGDPQSAARYSGSPYAPSGQAADYAPDGYSTPDQYPGAYPDQDYSAPADAPYDDRPPYPHAADVGAAPQYGSQYAYPPSQDDAAPHQPVAQPYAAPMRPAVFGARDSEPVTVAPGEQRMIGASYPEQAYGGAQYAAAYPSCDPNRVVRLQVRDCAGGGGLCAAAPHPAPVPLNPEGE